MRITWLMTYRCCECKFCNAIKSFCRYFYRNFTSLLLIRLSCILLLRNIFLLNLWLWVLLLELIFILLRNLIIFLLVILTSLDKVRLRLVFICEGLRFTWGCAYSFLRIFSLFFVLGLHIFSLKLNLLKCILL